MHAPTLKSPKIPKKPKEPRGQTSDNQIDNKTVMSVGTSGVGHVNGTRNGRGSAISPLSKRHLAAKVLDVTGVGSALRRLPAWRGLLILNYHRIGFPHGAELDRNLWSATPDAFDAQMQALQRNCDVIGLADLDHALRNRRARAAMITFDDGYVDNYTIAFGILKHHGLPATFFLTTGFLDRRLVPWWDEIAWMVRNAGADELPAGHWLDHPLRTDPAHREAAIVRLLKIYKQLNDSQTGPFLEFLAEGLRSGRCPPEVGGELWMTWDMAREMRAAGMTIGGHSVTHPVLARLSPERQDFEVGECRRRLVAELGEPIDAFSYPVGGGASFDATTKRAVERHGYRWGFTYLGGYLRPERFDRFALRRSAIETDIDQTLFHAMLALPQVFA
jgi:peptidoglycan/xylan/chitin deacetylase (PgdA/CDA1 family)